MQKFDVNLREFRVGKCLRGGRVREINLSLDQWELRVQNLQRRVILASTPKEQERSHAILLLAQEWTAAATTELLDRDPHTIRRWAAALDEGGPGALIFEHTGSSSPRPPLSQSKRRN